MVKGLLALVGLIFKVFRLCSSFFLAFLLVFYKNKLTFL